MKFPSYSAGAQGDLLIANALANDPLRPYAEVRHYDQIVSKQGMHLYVEDVPESEPAPQDWGPPAFGGVLRRVGHQPGLYSPGFASFKANGQRTYGPTKDLYGRDGLTDPAQTWPTFWRLGLSGPAAVWAQFARGFARAYMGLQERERAYWATLPDIGDAVVIAPGTRDGKPLVYCIKGTGPVRYVPVRVVPRSAFPGVRIPQEIVRRFGGVPLPPLEFDWLHSSRQLLSAEDVRAACGLAAPYEVTDSPQDAAFGPYAVSPDGRQADTVRVYRDAFTHNYKSAHIKLSFAATPMDALTVTVEKVSGGYTSYSLQISGIAWVRDDPSLTAPNPGAVGPGWEATGEATCPLLVTYVKGALTVFSSARRSERYKDSTSPTGTRVRRLSSSVRIRGGVSLEVPTFVWQGSSDPSYHTSTYVFKQTQTGGAGGWTITYFTQWTIDELYGGAVTPAPPRVGLMGFCGVEGCWSVAYHKGTTGSVTKRRYTKGAVSHTSSVTYEWGPHPDTSYGPITTSRRPWGAKRDTIGYIVLECAWSGHSGGPVTPFPTWETPGTLRGPIVHGPVQVHANGVEFSVDLTRLYTDAGFPVPTHEGADILYPLPRADPRRSAFIDIDVSVLGGQQVIARVAGLADKGRALPGMSRGSLVTSAEDAQFSHAHDVFFVGELQR